MQIKMSIDIKPGDFTLDDILNLEVSLKCVEEGFFSYQYGMKIQYRILLDGFEQIDFDKEDEQADYGVEDWIRETMSLPISPKDEFEQTHTFKIRPIKHTFSEKFMFEDNYRIFINFYMGEERMLSLSPTAIQKKILGLFNTGVYQWLDD